MFWVSGNGLSGNHNKTFRLDFNAYENNCCSFISFQGRLENVLPFAIDDGTC